MVSEAQRSTWRRVSRGNPCPKCGHADACLFLHDGRIVCTRVESSHRCPWGLGGWYHACPRAADGAAPVRPVSRKPVAESADADTRHAVYSGLLTLCPLSREHHRFLTGPGHGVSTEQAQRYGTLPSHCAARRRILDALIDRHGFRTLLTVAGFAHNERKELDIRGAGILLPNRDVEGCIVALDVRREVVQDGQSRYYKLSSKSEPDADAPSPGAPAHVARPAGGVRDGTTVWATEGIKKADYVADATGCMVVSMPGIGNWRVALPVLERLAGDRLIIALDQDDPEKDGGRVVAAVARTRAQLARASVALGYAVRIATWTYTVAKGVDDLLLGDHSYTLERYALGVAPIGADRACMSGRPRGDALGGRRVGSVVVTGRSRDVAVHV